VGMREKWVPYIKGAGGRAWCEPVDELVNWQLNGLQIKTFEADGILLSRPQNEAYYFELGVAFTSIGNQLLARAHRFSSIIGNAGLSVFGGSVAQIVCLLNSAFARSVAADLNPTVNFLVGDIERIPLVP